MNRKTKLKLNETLNKALEPPKRRNIDQLDALLSQYNAPDPTQHNPTQPNITLPNQVEISPTRDFTKVPNSITKEAIPNKFFKGMSKHTYDILYRQTRGNVKPVRKIQLTKIEIMKLTGLSFNTVQTHIKYLKEAGLVKVEFFIGKHEGSIYEVLIPEEIGNPTQPNPTQGETTPKTQPDTIQLLGLLGSGKNNENKEVTDSLKPSLKTREKIDDEPFGALNDVLKNGAERVSGAKGKKSDAENWKLIGELLIMELELAAARTGVVSNAPAFLAEHLRRRLQGNPSKEKTGKSGISVKKDAEQLEMTAIEETEYEAEPLTEKARTVVLKTFRDYIEAGQREYIMNLAGTYTGDDWKWLMENLEN